MCGITGIIAFNETGKKLIPRIDIATRKLALRGPDNEGIYKGIDVALGHRRLSIIDLSNSGNQPIKDATGNYVLIYNGEFYNYQEHREKLIQEGIEFKSSSDTEVLLHLLIKYGSEAIKLINGFFAFAFYNVKEGELLIARDRFGIKPLHVSFDENKLVFGSEIKSILSFGIDKELDQVSLYTYLQLNYIPPPNSIYKQISKLLPGHYWKISITGKIEQKKYYSIHQNRGENNLSYENSKTELKRLLELSVSRRMIADVEVGSFLSGGIDSSIIASIASKINPKLQTFSMGFENESFFDETKYAETLANSIKTNHTTYKINQDDLLQHMMKMLNGLDEPFADSSALAVSILSEKTRGVTKVALSGDGADEIFGGYNKHKAVMLYQKYHNLSAVISNLNKGLKILPQSRKSRLLNKIRQIQKFSEGIELNMEDRYWMMASFQQRNYVNELLAIQPNKIEFNERKSHWLNAFEQEDDELSKTLLTDLNLVLPGDMLTKVDRMSMQNSLEVRVPFLDHELVEFAFSLPTEYKINHKRTKRILRDTFSDLLPSSLLNRPKHGFEVPLEKWMKSELSNLIENDLLSKDLIETQKIFNYSEIAKLKKVLMSNQPGESPNIIWTIMVFNYWWKNTYL